MTNYKQLCTELVELGSSPARSVSELAERMSQVMDLADRARAALAEPEPEGPTDEEVDVWVDRQGFVRGHGDHPCGFWIDDGDAGALVRAALTRWGK